MTAFRGNVIAEHAHFLAKEYGRLPTEVLDRPARDFWRDVAIMEAGKHREQDMMDQNTQSTDAGTATDGQRQDLVDAQDERARQREQDGSASVEDQLEALDEIRGPG